MSITLLDLILILIAILFGLLFTLFIANCIATFCGARRTRKSSGSDVERLPDSYVEEIQRLLERHKQVEQQIYDTVPEEKEREYVEIAEPNVDTSASTPLPPASYSPPATPVQEQSRRNSAKLKQLKVELEQFRVSPCYLSDRDEVDYVAEMVTRRERSSQASPNKVQNLQVDRESPEKRRTWAMVSDSMFDLIDIPESSQNQTSTIRVSATVKAQPGHSKTETVV